MAFVGTAALAVGLAIGIVGYDRFGGNGSPNEPTSIPAASFFLPGTPQATGCDVPRREPGAIEKIMETPPSQTPYFPRVNQNPLTEPLVGTSGSVGAVDGTSLWMNSSPDDSVPEGIQQREHGKTAISDNDQLALWDPPAHLYQHLARPVGKLFMRPSTPLVIAFRRSQHRQKR